MTDETESVPKKSGGHAVSFDTALTTPACTGVPECVPKNVSVHVGVQCTTAEKNLQQQSQVPIKTAPCDLVQETANGKMTPTGFQPIRIRHFVITSYAI